MGRKSILVQPYRQHVAGRGMQDGIFREVEKNREPVPFTAAEHDEVAPESLSDADDFRFDSAGFDQLRPVLEPKLRRELLQARSCTIHELALDLDRGEQRLAHRLDGYVLYDVEQRDFAA